MKRHSNTEQCAPAEKSVINMIHLTAAAAQCSSDWPIIIIGPGGLLLVISHQFTVPVSV